MNTPRESHPETLRWPCPALKSAQFLILFLRIDWFRNLIFTNVPFPDLLSLDKKGRFTQGKS